MMSPTVNTWGRGVTQLFVDFHFAHAVRQSRKWTKKIQVFFVSLSHVRGATSDKIHPAAGVS